MKDKESKTLVERIKESGASERELNNLLKLSLTVANMDGREQILGKDLKQAFEVSLNDKMRTILNTFVGYDLKELPKEERNYAWYTYKGEEVVIVGQYLDYSFETEKFNGIEPLETSDNAAILRISDIENGGIKINPDDVQNTLDDLEDWNGPVEIICEQVVNPENEQKLTPFVFVSKDYYQQDLIERQLLTDTTKYHDWTSERTSFVHKIRDEVTLKEETLAEWKKVCSEITKDFSENGSDFNFDELWENITDYRNNQGIECSEYILDKFLDKVKEKKALKGFSEEEEDVILNFLSSKGITGVRKLSEFKDPSKKTPSEKQEKKKTKDISGREM